MKMLNIVRDFAVLGLVSLILGGCSGVAENEGTENVGASEQAISGQKIDVISATFGLNCGVTRGNATGSVAASCDGKGSCSPTVGYGMTGGDPAHGCDKDFDADWACGTVGTNTSGRLAVHVPAEANGKPAPMNCTSMTATTLGVINVTDASYGMNINSGLFNNVAWDVEPFCNGWGHCRYEISSATLGDPARGRDKDFRAHFTCSNDPAQISRTVSAPAEANRRVVSFDCP